MFLLTDDFKFPSSSPTQETMGLYTTPPPDLDEVDIIIVGGGAAGCIVAGRLAAADPKLLILIIEGGRNNKDVAAVVHPLFMLSNLNPRSKSALFYKASKSAHVADREVIVPTGGILGGGSSINFMLCASSHKSLFFLSSDCPWPIPATPAPNDPTTTLGTCPGGQPTTCGPF